MRLLRISLNLTRFSGLYVFVTVYISLFAIAGIILFGPLFRNHRYDTINTSLKYPFSKDKVNSRSPDYVSPSLSFLQRSIKTQKNGERFSRDGKGVNVLRSTLDLYWTHSNSMLINCTTLPEVSDTEYVATGWTKIVYKGIFRGQKVAVKTARYNGQDVQDCQKELGSSMACFERVDAKIIKEIILLTELAHRNVVKILGFCIPDTGGTATLVTELGEPIDTVRLLQISWEDRLRLVLGIGHILNHFAHSPLGSLSMNDFRREQFVIVDGILKVTDLDDVGIGEPECFTDDVCQNITNFTWNGNTMRGNTATKISSCVNFRCVGHNSRMNVWRAGQHFVKLLLPIGAPEFLQPYIEDLIDTYEFKKKIHGVSPILQGTQHIVDLYKSGSYMNFSTDLDKLGFKKIDGADLPGMFDYHCRYSVSAGSCVMSVFSEEEAAQLCAKDLDCKAVILSSQQTWTGRTIAIFKNGFHSPVVGKGFTLLLKEDLNGENHFQHNL